ncbi:MAG: energy-coupling factor ABC transporter permease [Desulfobulbaceae bacterium]|nr:energy-coupling factor ABC transporter permease [Desulfobulbaceae bacterium]
MHMADALLSPAVGGTMWVATAGMAAYCSKKVGQEMDDSKVPLMGVLGAFIFASQMINFTIPATGSSGHLGGGLILAVLLGPYAAFLVMASVLTVQSLFFADGGILALGANIFNLGFFPCFIALPLIYKPLLGKKPTAKRISIAAIVAGVVGLQLGAFAVVLETVLSGISELPFTTFLLLMQPIHLGIGLVEGIVTAGVINFVWQSQPEIMVRAAAHQAMGSAPVKKVLIALAVVTIITGGAFSWFASSHPDGLEWSIAKVAGGDGELESSDGLHGTLARLQQKTAFLPDYGFRSTGDSEKEAEGAKGEPSWPAVDPGTSVAGLVGGILTLLVAIAIGWLLRQTSKKSS